MDKSRKDSLSFYGGVFLVILAALMLQVVETRILSAVDGKPAPWFWGINGAAGVLASSLAVACSIAYGIDITLIVAASCYILLIPAAVSIGTGWVLSPAYEPA